MLREAALTADDPVLIVGHVVREPGGPAGERGYRDAPAAAVSLVGTRSRPLLVTDDPLLTGVIELEVELEITSPLELALTSPLELEPPIPPVVDDVLDEAGAPPAPPELPATGGSYVHAPRTTPAITPVTTTGLNLFFRYIGVLHAKQASP